MNVLITEQQYKLITNLITEEPGAVKFVNGGGIRVRLELDSGDALAFGFMGGHAFVGFNEHLNRSISKEFEEYVSIGGYRIEHMIYHPNIWRFYDFLSLHRNSPIKLPKHTDRENFSDPGRLWLDRKVISFYNAPSQFNYFDNLKKLEKSIYDVYGFNISLNDFKIDAYFDKDKQCNVLLTPNQYFGIPEKEVKNYDMDKIHLLPAKVKRVMPQMKSVRDYDTELKAEKFKETPEYLWNFNKNKNLAENKKPTK